MGLVRPPFETLNHQQENIKERNEMNIYIASSWSNQHAVEMMTGLLEADGHKVKSFVRNAQEHGYGGLTPDNDEWIKSSDGEHTFIFNTHGAMESDLVIYIGPSGCDSWAEVGVAWMAGVPVVGLWAKGERVGLMRRMMERWYDDYQEVILFARALAYKAGIDEDDGGESEPDLVDIRVVH